jgi:CheY-like chemotaxis protein
LEPRSPAESGRGTTLETILTDEGYRVLTACNGKQALAKMANAMPDLILLDFMMPILDGAGMLRAIAVAPAYQHIPVIMISSLNQEVIAKKCAGYAAFLRKPFRVAAVLSATVPVVWTASGEE